MPSQRVRTPSPRVLPLFCLLSTTLLALFLPGAARAQTCARTLVADVVAFDQVFFWNRLGAVQPQGMMYALRRDVVPISGSTLSPGNVRLRADKRPRPMVLRMNVGDCIRIDFQNLLDSNRRDQEQPATRWASVRAVGAEFLTIDDAASYVGRNDNTLVDVGQSTSYFYYAEREGEHVLYSAGATNGGEGDGGSTNSGLFGALIVEPAGSVWYRSQVTRADLDRATTGTNQYGQPILDYTVRYPVGHPQAGRPVLAMLDGVNIVHTDLTALIVGTGGQRAGWFPPNTFPPNIFTLPQRHQPFREFTIIYHDEIGAVQAFPQFEDNVLQHTLHGGRDAFAINYGTGGIGAEILANRLRVGPMHNCAECKFEEFFLSSWSVGDPAMVVDRPANVPCGPDNITSPNSIGQDPNLPIFVDNLRDGDPCTSLPNAKATKAFFPDDPANVYHGYLNDHTKFRVLHAGTKEHHIHHLHAHQWLFTADSDKSTYLDSQAIGPGSSFTAEIAYDGGGNQNKTVGDAIFHCHFYPHFAQGMWSLWRVHDVFERGTLLDANGRPASGSRALPDGEIAAGTPIPAVVPLPGIPMAPVPQATASIVGGQVQISGAGNPGYPFFIPANAGHRPPKPPRDTIHDGGLSRHNITAGTFNEAHTRLDWHKELLTAVAQQLPEMGTAVEDEAVMFHSQFGHPSCEPNGNCVVLTCPSNPSQPCTPLTFECEGSLCTEPMVFRTNGKGGQPGAPFADPCPVEDAQLRFYKVADIQTDVRLNKKGWHFPQQRFSALWEDVASFLDPPFGSTKKPPEPLFFRANSNDCITFWLTNLVPNEYELDDFQVRTPTDVLGQHIHLVKFDVTASDGAANGFNYEDGSFSPEEVRERIAAIRAQNGCTPSDPRNNTFACPTAKLHPFAPFQREEWRGAQTTVQRWYADPLLDNNGNDRTLRTVFTHDHFGPSTHQQAGLYAGLVVEPALSTWKHNETGTPFYTRDDGGPTSWQAVITPPSGPDYREFLLEYGDFQLAYEEDNTGFPDPNDAVNPPGRKEIGIPDLLARPLTCPTKDGSAGPAPPCPEIISADDPGTMAVNYRQEPIALRVRNPATNGQATGNAGDLSFAFSSNVNRADTAFNNQPNFYAPLTFDLNGRDPYTPILRAYENDRVQIRVLVGAHEEGHNFSVHGIKWLFEPSEPNSGYKNSQMMGISEHFEFIVPQLIKNPTGAYVDRLYSVGSSTDDYWNGIWGLLRAYTGLRPDLEPLPSNPNGSSGIDPGAVGAFTFSCPKDTLPAPFDVTAITAQQAITGGRLVYNNRTDGAFGPLFDPTAILYVRTDDLDSVTNQLKPGRPIEPLVLRARAGECIKLTLRNKLPETLLELNGFNTLPMVVEGFNANDITPSRHVGLHPQMLYYDVSRFDAANVGGNSTQTVAPGAFTTYEWYAGDVTINADGSVTATPIEFGATNLISSDRIEHASKGAIGALIIEPANAVWTEGGTGCTPPVAGGRCTATFADVSAAGGPVPAFREFVLQFQNDVNMRTDVEMTPRCNVPTGGVVSPHGAPVENLACIEDPEDSGQKALNYRTEPLWKRMQMPPGTPLNETRDRNDWWNVVSNTKVGTILTDPQTPVFLAQEGQEIRFRVLESGGHQRNHVFALHGHTWDKEPYVQNSTKIGRNGFSFWEGARFGHGPSNHFDALIRHGAGGKFSVVGDFLFRDQVAIGFDNGLWGILRVE